MTESLIGWARVSTTDQTLDVQVEALKAFGCTKIFEGKHSGKGKGKNADALAAMVDYVRDGDTVVCTKLDRLGRSLREVLQTVDLLKDMGVTLKCIDQPIDTSKEDAFSNAMLQLLGVFAEMERTFINERTMAGRIASGNFGGRPVKLDDDQKVEIQRRNATGETARSLAKEYGVSPATISRVINTRILEREKDGTFGDE